MVDAAAAALRLISTGAVKVEPLIGAVITTTGVVTATMFDEGAELPAALYEIIW